jgi:hypothetical protein
MEEKSLMDTEILIFKIVYWCRTHIGNPRDTIILAHISLAMRSQILMTGIQNTDDYHK